MPFSISGLSLDRNSLGFDNIPYYKEMVQWKITDAIYVVLIFALDWYYFETIEPYQRQFTINDLTISHPFAKVERVSASALMTWITVIPTIVMLAFTMLLTPRPFKFYVLYLSILGVFISMGTCIFVTDVMKNWIGRCRPDFLERCIPSKDALPDVLYFAKDICTNKNKRMLLDGFRTTPSGHSSMAWSAFGYLSLWLSGQFNSNHIHRGAWRSIVSFLPILLAIYVALSRTQDYRHHFVDVIIGSVLGFLVSLWSYHRIFPAVTSKQCYIPWLLLETDPNTVNESEDYYRNAQIAMDSYTPTGEADADITLGV